MTDYFRAIPQTDPARPDHALPLAGGWAWFTHVEVLARGAATRIVPLAEVHAEALQRMTAPRAPIAGLDTTRPRLMGIVNLTPDSFSDGGRYYTLEAALTQARALLDQGADILDLGGESTRPGAPEVPEDEEIARTVPLIRALREGGIRVPISIDTRKAAVARAALEAGADMVNDVSGFEFDPAMQPLVAETGAPVALMHMQGTPETMQREPQYEDVLLDVYDSFETRLSAAEAAGIPRARIMVDPGIGFGKTDIHNRALLRRLSLLHSLGCPILLGVSRKGFIGRVGAIPDAAARGPASAAIGLWGLSQGVQMLRVHDMDVHRQMLALWRSMQEFGK